MSTETPPNSTTTTTTTPKSVGWFKKVGQTTLGPVNATTRPRAGVKFTKKNQAKLTTVLPTTKLVSGNVTNPTKAPKKNNFFKNIAIVVKEVSNVIKIWKNDSHHSEDGEHFDSMTQDYENSSATISNQNVICVLMIVMQAGYYLAAI